jgi:hypothetical protein
MFYHGLGRCMQAKTTPSPMASNSFLIIAIGIKIALDSTVPKGTTVILFLRNMSTREIVGRTIQRLKLVRLPAWPDDPEAPPLGAEQV